MSKPRVIAFYLPQFHPIPENDEWWGKGFTEWTNVGKAKPLYPGHKQPKIPTDLGYYDLRLSETRELQAQIAKSSGIEGFCYWHYWFGEGKELLERPINDVVREGKPDFPFCLAWANESWYSKIWSKDKTLDKLLIEQKYGGEKDYTAHFYSVLNKFRDERYIKVNGKVLFMIYKPEQFSDCSKFILLWRQLAEKNGLVGIHFVANSERNIKNPEKYFDIGFDAVFTDRMWLGAKVLNAKNPLNVIKNILCTVFRLPKLVPYKNIVKFGSSAEDKRCEFYPGIVCTWDHTPRSGRKGMVFTGFSLKLFAKHCKDVFSIIKDKPAQEKIVFLKSWNEWGEGNFMEPDMEYGYGKINTLKDCLKDF